ncbi:uncharacterized protein Ecym_3401 [Eremothecium cymbalariae DBVPG|uniref:Uncharacterized protein n=1 Tax=Eremothecium cymbalariae (strain CBS 270.75 / DBVPG 7215 / KCTC 17166 / NRRL Y-17582) TaxID=931890 RepID=G8JRW9_ERECY|nr:Hypothetical protein Ecym_3401 [Eremothecium cymbalariae DBVPG\
MASTINTSIVNNTIKDATVSQGYYSVSRGTLLSRDAYADKDTVNNENSLNQEESEATVANVRISKHGRHRFRRWLSKIYYREDNKVQDDKFDEDLDPDFGNNVGSSAIATAGTTAGMDDGEFDLGVSAKIGGISSSSFPHTTIKLAKLSQLSSDTGSDTQVDQPTTLDLEDSGSLKLRPSKKFHTLKDWIHKTLRRKRNTLQTIHYQNGMVISDISFDSERQCPKKTPIPKSLSPFRSKSTPPTPALALGISSSAQPGITMSDTATEIESEFEESDSDTEREIKGQRIQRLMALDTHRVPSQRTNIASFNSIGHLGDIAIMDDEEEDGDMYIKLKDIGLSPTNDFYRELYAICNI